MQEKIFFSDGTSDNIALLDEINVSGNKAYRFAIDGEFDTIKVKIENGILSFRDMYGNTVDASGCTLNSINYDVDSGSYFVIVKYNQQAYIQSLVAKISALEGGQNG